MKRRIKNKHVNNTRFYSIKIKTTILVILLSFSFRGYSQNLKSDLESLFFNQPIFDSIHEVSKGKFNISFLKWDCNMPLPGNALRYVYSFKNHNLYPKASGHFIIEKSCNDTLLSGVRLALDFKSSKEQLLTFNKIQSIISKYPNVKTTIEDYKDKDKVIGKNIKMIVTINNIKKTFTIKYINYQEYFKSTEIKYRIEIKDY